MRYAQTRLRHRINWENFWKQAGEVLGMIIILAMAFVAGLGWLEVLAR